MPRRKQDENLKKGKATQFKTGEEQAKIARKGGIASGESRRRAKTMREIALAIHAAPINTDIPGVKDRLAMVGLDPARESNSALLVSALFTQAAQGDMKAFEKWMELVGETYSAKESNDKLDALIEAVRKT